MNFVNITVSQAQSLFASTSVGHQPTASNAARVAAFGAIRVLPTSGNTVVYPEILVLCRQDRRWPFGKPRAAQRGKRRFMGHPEARKITSCDG